MAGRMFDPEVGRFISRDPLGYVDGMSLYNGYFAERFALDPWGTDVTRVYEQPEMDIDGGFNANSIIADIKVSLIVDTSDCELTYRKVYRGYDGFGVECYESSCTGEVVISVFFEWKPRRAWGLNVRARVHGFLVSGKNRAPLAGPGNGLSEPSSATVEVQRISCSGWGIFGADNEDGTAHIVVNETANNSGALNRDDAIVYDIDWKVGISSCGKISTEDITLKTGAGWNPRWRNGPREVAE